MMQKEATRIRSAEIDCIAFQDNCPSISKYIKVRNVAHLALNLPEKFGQFNTPSKWCSSNYTGNGSQRLEHEYKLRTLPYLKLTRWIIPGNH